MRIADPLHSLSLDIFHYDQTCEMPPLPLEPRLENRNYPFIIARWSGYGWPPIGNRPELSDAENIAHHDLWYSGGEFGLRFVEEPQGFLRKGDVDNATRLRDNLLAHNPNIVILVSFQTSADLTEFPED